MTDDKAGRVRKIGGVTTHSIGHLTDRRASAITTPSTSIRSIFWSK
jgi:hypothetical protein